jgi:hypothetical protein
MSARLVCAALVFAALDPTAGCKKIIAQAKGTAPADDTAQVTPDPTAAPTVAPTGAAPTGSAAATGAPAGDALLTLGTAEWLQYGDAKAFTVLLPQKPQESAPAIKTGGVQITGRQATASRVGAIYTFAFADLPATARGDAKTLLDGARDDAVRNVPTAVLRGEREIKLGKNLGREWQAEATSPFPMIITAHFYVVGRRLYEQTITVPASVSEGGYVDKFFGSLTIPNEGTGATMIADAADSQPAGSASASPSASASAGKPPKKKK